MKIRMSYFDMLDGRYRTAAHLGMNYVSTTKGNRYARTRVKREHREFIAAQARLEKEYIFI